MGELQSFTCSFGSLSHPCFAYISEENLCLKMDNTPMYMSPVPPGQLMQVLNTGSMPPVEPPSPLLTLADVVESPLPLVSKNDSASDSGGPTASPKASPSSQPRITASLLMIACLPVIVSSSLLFWRARFKTPFFKWVDYGCTCCCRCFICYFIRIQVLPKSESLSPRPFLNPLV